ncbi:MAG: hypothetical protein ACLTW9_29640 [Enterocloster sp.]
MKQIKAASRGEKGRKMEDIENFLDKTNCILTEYDDKLVRTADSEHQRGKCKKGRGSIQIWNYS